MSGVEGSNAQAVTSFRRPSRETSILPATEFSRFGLRGIAPAPAELLDEVPVMDSSSLSFAFPNSVRHDF